MASKKARRFSGRAGGRYVPASNNPLPSGLLFRLRGDDLAPGVSVATWSDASGNSLGEATQATSGNQPVTVADVAGGHIGVKFDGVNDRMTLSSSVLDLFRNRSDATVFVTYAYPVTVTGTRTLLSFSSGTVNNVSRVALLQRDSGGVPGAGGRRLDADAGSFISGTGAGSTGYAVETLSAWFDWANSNLTLYKDSVQVAQQLTFQTAGATSDTSSLAAALGSNSAQSSEFFAGIILDVLVFGELTSLQRAQVHTYLATTYVKPAPETGTATGAFAFTGTASGDAPAVLPTSNLLYRFRADDLTPGAVTSWTDVGAAGSFTQGTTANQPTAVADALGEHTGVVFDGTSDRLAAAGALLDMFRNRNDITVFAVYKYPTAVTGVRTLMSFSTGTSSTTNRLSLQQRDGAGLPTTGGRRLDADAASFISGPAGSASAAGSIEVLSAWFNWAGSDLTLYKAGTQIAQQLNFHAVGSTSDTASLAGSIGSSPSGSGEFFAGTLFEILVYGTLTSTQRSQVVAYLTEIYQEPPPPPFDGTISNTDLPGWDLTFADHFDYTYSEGDITPNSSGILVSGPAAAELADKFAFSPDGAAATYDGQVFAKLAGETGFPGDWPPIVSKYYPSRTISFSESKAKIRMHTEVISGTSTMLAATIRPRVGTAEKVGPYYRWSFRMRATQVVIDGVDIAAQNNYSNDNNSRFIWVPTGIDIANWPANGQINWPNSIINRAVSGTYHPSSTTSEPNTVPSGENPFAWNVYTVEWAPGRLRLFCNGEMRLDTTDRVPTAPQSFTFRFESDNRQPPADAYGTVEIDWVTMHSHNPNSNILVPNGTLPGPTTGALWVPQQVEDFTTADMALGTIVPVTTGSDTGLLPASNPYYQRFKVKTTDSPDTDGNALYSAPRTTSITNGVMDIWCHNEGGQAYGGAVKLLNQSAADTNFFTYGRVSVRMWATSTGVVFPATARYGGVSLLINNNQWSQSVEGWSEHDWPERKLDSVAMGGFYHPTHPPGTADTSVGVSCPVGTEFKDPHIYTIEWFPEGAGARTRWYVDDVECFNRTTQVPVAPMKLGHLIQVGSTGGVPTTAESAHLYIDWIALHRYQAG